MIREIYSFMLQFFELDAKLFKATMHIKVDICDKVSIIRGYGATGKTLMLSKLNYVCNNPSFVLNSNIPIASVVVCLEYVDFMNAINSNISNKLIFIDRFDYIRYKEPEKSVQFITESNNIFVVCAHHDVDIGCASGNFLGVRFNPDTFSFETYKIQGDEILTC